MKEIFPNRNGKSFFVFLVSFQPDNDCRDKNCEEWNPKSDYKKKFKTLNCLMNYQYQARLFGPHEMLLVQFGHLDMASQLPLMESKPKLP